MNEIIGYMVIALAVLIIAINVAISVFPKFRRWVYSKD